MMLSKSLGSLQHICSTFKVLNSSKWGLNGMDCSYIIYSVALVSVIVVLHLTLITCTLLSLTVSKVVGTTSITCHWRSELIVL